MSIVNEEYETVLFFDTFSTEAGVYNLILESFDELSLEKPTLLTDVITITVSANLNTGPPKFDFESISESTILMEEDAEGAAYSLSPVSLDCSEEWSRFLPTIKGEDSTEEFYVTVNL